MVTKHPGEQIHSCPIDPNNGKTGLFVWGFFLGKKFYTNKTKFDATSREMYSCCASLDV